MKRFILVLMVVWGIGNSAFSECYLEVDNPSALDTKAISQVSLIQISKYFEPISEIPPQGISSDACLYNLSISELANGLLLTIKGRKVTTYGDSKLRGFDGFQQALFRSIISAKPAEKEGICQRYLDIMSSDCGNIMEPPKIQHVQKGTINVRVPKRFRQAVIYSSDVVIGEMAGQRRKKFEVETNRLLTLKAIDGEYISEEIQVTVFADEETRIKFRRFERPDEEFPEPKPVVETQREQPVRERQKSAFGENNPFIIGFGIGGHDFSSEEDEYRKRDPEIENGLNLNFFLEYYLTENIGIGFKTFVLSAIREGTNYEQDLSISNSFFTVSLWFPLSTKNKGYSHFGLIAGSGNSQYKVEIKNKNTDKLVEEWKAEGSASLMGVFFDWGGEIFGARIGYNVIQTDLGKMSRQDENSSAKFKVDGSGSGMVFDFRWAW